MENLEKNFMIWLEKKYDDELPDKKDFIADYREYLNLEVKPYFKVTDVKRFNGLSLYKSFIRIKFPGQTTAEMNLNWERLEETKKKHWKREAKIRNTKQKQNFEEYNNFNITLVKKKLVINKEETEESKENITEETEESKENITEETEESKENITEKSESEETNQDKNDKKEEKSEENVSTNTECSESMSMNNVETTKIIEENTTKENTTVVFNPYKRNTKIKRPVID